jgi:hypothetical protein
MLERALPDASPPTFETPIATRGQEGTFVETALQSLSAEGVSGYGGIDPILKVVESRGEVSGGEGAADGPGRFTKGDWNPGPHSHGGHVPF